MPDLFDEFEMGQLPEEQFQIKDCDTGAVVDARDSKRVARLTSEIY